MIVHITILCEIRWKKKKKQYNTKMALSKSWAHKKLKHFIWYAKSNKFMCMHPASNRTLVIKNMSGKLMSAKNASIQYQSKLIKPYSCPIIAVLFPFYIMTLIVSAGSLFLRVYASSNHSPSHECGASWSSFLYSRITILYT